MRFNQPLNLGQISKGIAYCYRNANELAEESEILLRENKLARALALSVLAREEGAKLVIIARAWSFGNDSDQWNSFWKRFRNHKSKLRMDVRMNPSPTRLKKKTFELEAAIVPHMTETMKELAFYVDCEKDGFTLPNNLFSEGFVKSYLSDTRHALELYDILWKDKSENEIAKDLASYVKSFERRGFSAPIKDSVWLEFLIPGFQKQVTDDMKKGKVKLTKETLRILDLLKELSYSMELLNTTTLEGNRRFTPADRSKTRRAPKN